MYDTWLFNGNGFTPNYNKEAARLRANGIFIQEWYDDKKNAVSIVEYPM